ncbi:MAG: T9SS type A sorting domain-containing protein, partial [Bacteroidetes bacterium]|nr:T9SS type A sorting domain-containing protein [Bacteroidota bacterium]
LADSCAFATNNIGAYFSVDSLIPQDSKVLPYTPQINVTGIISDTSVWTEVIGEYVAAGGERFVVFGNFFSDENTDTISTGVDPVFFNGQKFALYYFDNVSLCLCDDTVSTDNNSNYFDRITVFPNPASDFVTIRGVEDTRGAKATLYDIAGVQIQTQQLENSGGQFQFSLGGIASGVYVLEITVSGETRRVKVVKSE